MLNIPSGYLLQRHEPCWELKFVGERFKGYPRNTDVVAVFKMLAAAYDTLEEWSKSREANDVRSVSTLITLEFCDGHYFAWGLTYAGLRCLRLRGG